MQTQITDTLPKLDHVGYLFDTIGFVQEHLSFEDIRKALLELRPDARERGERVTSSTSWSNARDALRELMRLGLVNRSTLPSRPAQLDAHRSRTFSLTEDGSSFLSVDQRDAWEFRHRFAQAMLLGHPYLRGLHRLASSAELFIPRLQRSELPGNVAAWKTGPPDPLRNVARWVTEAVESAVGLHLIAEDLEARMRPYLSAAWKRLDLGQKSHLLTKAVVKAFNDVVVRVLLQAYGIRMDSVTFRAAVALMSDLNAIWHTRSVPGRRGLTLWATADAPIPEVDTTLSAAAQALRGPVWFRPTGASDEAIRDVLIETFFTLPDRRGGFALIHVLRAHLCHRMRIHGRTFDAVLRKLHAQTLIDPTYAINLDRGSGDELPQSEEPFRIGETAFYLITLLKRSETGGN